MPPVAEKVQLYKQSDQTAHQGLVSKSKPVSLPAAGSDSPKQPTSYQNTLAKQDFEQAADTAEVYSGARDGGQAEFNKSTSLQASARLQARADSTRSQTAKAFDYLTSQLTPTKDDKESNPEMVELKSAARGTAQDTKQVTIATLETYTTRSSRGQQADLCLACR